MLRKAALSALVLTSLALAQDKPTPATAPTRVTMNHEGALAEEVLTELANIGGIALKVDNPAAWNNADMVFLSAKDKPFWPTFIDVCRQARVHFDLWSHDNTRQVRLNPGTEYQYSKMPTCEVGGSLLLLQHASRNYSLSFQHPEQSHNQFTLSAILMPDPKLRISGSDIRPEITEALDENGVSLKRPADDQSYNHYGPQRGLFLNTMLGLSYPANAGRKIASLKGNLRMKVVTKDELWEIKDVLNAKPQTKQLASHTVTFKSLKKRAEGGNYELQLTLKSKGGNRGRRGNDEYQAGWALVQGIEIQSADGAKFHSGGGGGGDDWQVYFNAPSAQAVPATLSWRIPLETQEVAERFEFKDVPIP